MTLGEKVKQCRTKIGMSEETLANLLNVGSGYIVKLEKDEVTPDTNIVVRISNIFNVSTDYLLKSDLDNASNCSNDAQTSTYSEVHKVSNKRLVRSRYKTIKAWAIIGAILTPLSIGGSIISIGAELALCVAAGYYLILSIPLCIIAVLKAKYANKQSDLIGIGIFSLMLLSFIGGIILLTTGNQFFVNENEADDRKKKKTKKELKQENSLALKVEQEKQNKKEQELAAIRYPHVLEVNNLLNNFISQEYHPFDKNVARSVAKRTIDYINETTTAEDADKCVADFKNRLNKFKLNHQYYVNKRKKTVKGLCIAAASLTVVAVCAVVAVHCVKVTSTTQEYNSSLQLMYDGDYASAKQSFTKLGEYKDSQQKVKVCDGLICLDECLSDSSCNIRKGIDLIVGAGETVNVAYLDRKNVNYSYSSETYTQKINSANYTFKTPDEYTGYSFVKWIASKAFYKDNQTYLSLVSNWNINHYSINYFLDGGVNNSGNPDSYTVRDTITLYKPTKTGYSFTGWTDKDGNSVTKISAGTTGDLILRANWSVNSYELNVYNDDEKRGTVSGAGTYQYKSSVTVYAFANTNARFEGWYANSKKVSSNSTYTFSMPSYNYQLTAKWTNLYLITVETENSEKGTVSNGGYFALGENVTITAYPLDGYSFEGWYKDGSSNKLSSSNPYNFTVSNNDETYVAYFISKSYKVTAVTEDETKGTVSGSGEYAYKSSVSVSATPELGYSFEGWYLNDEKVSNDSEYTFEMPNNDVNLTAKFTADPYVLEVSSSAKSRGTVDGGGTYLFGSTVTVEATVNDNYVFDGWYDGDANVSNANPYTFTMPSNSVCLTAKFITNIENETSAPTLSDDSKYINYGLYPQSLVSDETLIADLNELQNEDENGYYELNGNLYSKLIATPYSSEETFDNGEYISANSTYWFICEPIEWRILSSEGKQYFVTSEMLLDCGEFNENYTGELERTDYQGNTGSATANNYQFSELRTWFNTSFLNKAFYINDSFIDISEIECTWTSSGAGSRGFVKDKVFALSYQEMDYKNGFGSDGSADSKKLCTVTEYSRVKGAMSYTDYQKDHTGSYYTRSYSYTPTSCTSCVAIADYLGYLYDHREYKNATYCNNAYYGIRPTMNVTI